jgi:transcriptional regulator with XRE-family HTH domain
MTDMTLAELGQAVGATPQRVSDWEGERREISKTIAKRLRELFNRSAGVFVQGARPRCARRLVVACLMGGLI